MAARDLKASMGKGNEIPPAASREEFLEQKKAKDKISEEQSVAVISHPVVEAVKQPVQPIIPPVQPERRLTRKLYVEISEENYIHLKRESGALGMQIKSYIDQLLDNDRLNNPHHYMDY